MNCDPPVRINPLPECIESEAYNPYYMEGLNFADADTAMIAKVRDVATGKMVYIDFETDEDGIAQVDINSLFPLLNHVYEIKFVNKETGNPENFTITNVDTTTSTGCCLEFTVNMGMIDNNGFFEVTSQQCAV